VTALGEEQQVPVDVAALIDAQGVEIRVAAPEEGDGQRCNGDGR
jgi:hypothetical protein